MTTDPQLESDLAVVAQHAVAIAANDLCDSGWELYPELGEYDWKRVVGYVLNATPYPDHAAYLAAYDRLSARAEHTE